MSMTNAHRVSLLARAKRMSRVMRAHPYLALLIEGFMLFALVSFLRTPSAWADVYEVESGGGQQSGVAVENVTQETVTDSDHRSLIRYKSDYPELKDQLYTTKEKAKEAEKEVDRQRSKGNNSNQSAGNQSAGNQSEGNQSAGNQSEGKQSAENQSAENQSAGNQSAGNTPAGNQPANGTSNNTGQQGLQNPDALNVSTFMQRLDGIVTHFLLPVAVAWAAWQLVYVALVCGLIGIDPLHVVNSRGDITQVDIGAEVRNRLKNFAYGLAWIAGVWLIFEVCVFLVSNLVGILEARL